MCWRRETRFIHEQLQKLHTSVAEPEATTLNATINETKTSVHHSHSSKFVTFLIPDNISGNMTRVETPSTSTPSMSKSPLSFKEISLKILDRTPTSAPKNPSCKR